MTKTQEEIRIGSGLLIRFLLEGRESAGTAAVFELEVGAGAKVPIAHSHDAYEETMYGLEGVLTLTLEGKRHDVASGQVLCIPRGAVHRFDNFLTGTSKTLTIITPGILGPDYFREIAAVVNRAAGGPPDHAAIAEIMRRHGLTPAP